MNQPMSRANRFKSNIDSSKRMADKTGRTIDYDLTGLPDTANFKPGWISKRPWPLGISVGRSFVDIGRATHSQPFMRSFKVKLLAPLVFPSCYSFQRLRETTFFNFFCPIQTFLFVSRL